MNRNQSTLLQNWGYYGKEKKESKASEKHFEAVEGNNDKKKGKIFQNTSYSCAFAFYRSPFHYFLPYGSFSVKFFRSVLKKSLP